MDEVLKYLKTQRIGILSTLSASGIPQSAALHFAHQDSPLKFFFSTEKTSRKYQNTLDHNKASLVVGFAEDEMITIQMDGEVEALTGEKLAAGKEVYFGKYPGGRKYENSPNTAYISFTPNWVRISDYKGDSEKVTVVLG